NGAGKTTLLKIISTLILPDKGRVTVNNCILGTDDEKIRSFIGFAASPERSFYLRLTGKQNLEFFAALYGLGGKEALSRINELFDLFKINYQDKRFDSYSTGMQQKFGIMRALLQNPELLLLDEPAKSLDYSAAGELHEFLRGTLVKKQAKTVIFTTHRMDEAADLADIFLVLHKGKVLGFGGLEQLRRKANKPQAALSQIYTALTSQ
ncbi:MAG: ATP-binding cassette domain-containing protein, partial [Candidatus Omnitrophica bacterium]|nr:ATP-binding cassette domain-containing protein [Candidatus Omnitrophota bacterium]